MSAMGRPQTLADLRLLPLEIDENHKTGDHEYAAHDGIVSAVTDACTEDE
jgi:hypothetical protein